MKRLYLLCCFWAIAISALAETKYQEADSLVFVNYVRYAQSIGHAPSVAETGKYFLNTPYVSGVLDRENNEPLVVNLRELDCVTFVEHVVALTLIVRTPNPEWQSYVALLQSLRYRDGNRNAYASRLHYLSEWIQQAESNHFLKETTCDWGGTPYLTQFYLLSAGRKKQQGDKVDTIEIRKLEEIEQRLSKMNYCCLPKNALSPNLQEGDLIAFCGDGSGIDVWHVGIVVRKGTEWHLLHASSTQKKVIISSQPLVAYMQSIKRYQGYRVIRLN